jgi:hypothetical protein
MISAQARPPPLGSGANGSRSIETKNVYYPLILIFAKDQNHGTQED